MADLKLIHGERTASDARRAPGATMQTKHINDKLDPIAIEAKALSVVPAGADEAPSRQGTSSLRLIEDADGSSERTADDAAPEDAAPSLTATPAADRPVRLGFVLHPLSHRVVPYWRRRR